MGSESWLFNICVDGGKILHQLIVGTMGSSNPYHFKKKVWWEKKYKTYTAMVGLSTWMIIRIPIHIYIHTYIQTYIHIYIYIHKYTYFTTQYIEDDHGVFNSSHPVLRCSPGWRHKWDTRKEWDAREGAAARLGSLGSSTHVTWTGKTSLLVGGLVAIFYFPIYWVANHPNWLSYFSEGFKPPTRLNKIFPIYIFLGVDKILTIELNRHIYIHIYV